jgi:hypothetical protein
MGIAEVEPRQLAPTVGTTGSGSTDSSAPSPAIADLSTPTRIDDSSSAMAVNSAPPIGIDIDSTATNFDINTSIDVNTALTTNVGIAVPTIIDATPPATMVNIAESATIDTASPSITDLTPAATTINPASSLKSLS